MRKASKQWTEEELRRLYPEHYEKDAVRDTEMVEKVAILERDVASLTLLVAKLERNEHVGALSSEVKELIGRTGKLVTLATFKQILEPVMDAVNKRISTIEKRIP